MASNSSYLGNTARASHHPPLHSAAQKSSRYECHLLLVSINYQVQLILIPIPISTITSTSLLSSCILCYVEYCKGLLTGFPASPLPCFQSNIHIIITSLKTFDSLPSLLEYRQITCMVYKVSYALSPTQLPNFTSIPSSLGFGATCPLAVPYNPHVPSHHRTFTHAVPPFST